MSYLAEELSENATKGVKNEVRDVHLVQGDVSEKSWREGTSTTRPVAMRYESIDARTGATGRVVSGDPDNLSESTEIWTSCAAPAPTGRSPPSRWSATRNNTGNKGNPRQRAPLGAGLFASALRWILSVRGRSSVAGHSIGDVGETLGTIQRLGIVAPAAAYIAGMAGVVGEVELVRVVERNAGLVGRLAVVPADELHGIGKIGAPCGPAAEPR